jgi:hypothetical protein
MPDIAIFALATCVAVLMLIVAVRALTWHKVSPALNSILLLLVLFVTWQLLARGGPVSLEQGVLFALCGLVGLVVGLVRGMTTPMRYVPREGGVLCRRGALLIFGWAAVVVTSITLLTMPGLHAPAWAGFLPPALVFLTAAFTFSTFTILSRVSSLRREQEFQAASEEQSQTLAQ